MTTTLIQRTPPQTSTTTATFHYRNGRPRCLLQCPVADPTTTTTVFFLRLMIIPHGLLYLPFLLILPFLHHHHHLLLLLSNHNITSRIFGYRLRKAPILVEIQQITSIIIIIIKSHQISTIKLHSHHQPRSRSLTIATLTTAITTIRHGRSTGA